MGPFDKPLENLHVSPFMTREKSDSVKRRVIVDLSWPKGGSVNDSVSDNTYMGTDFILTLPNIEHVIKAISKF